MLTANEPTTGMGLQVGIARDIEGARRLGRTGGGCCVCRLYVGMLGWLGMLATMYVDKCVMPPPLAVGGVIFDRPYLRRPVSD